MSKTTLELGKWNVICDRCGFKFKNTELRKDWQGLMVCKDDFELRNQQDFIRIRPEEVAPPWVRPEAPDQFIFSCDIWTSSSMADYGTADCMTVGGTSNIPLLIEIFTPTSIVGSAIVGRSIVGV